MKMLLRRLSAIKTLKGRRRLRDVPVFAHFIFFQSQRKINVVSVCETCKNRHVPLSSRPPKLVPLSSKLIGTSP